MDCLNRLERHDKVPRILDINHQLRPAMRGDLPHGTEHLAPVRRKHLISDCDRVVRVPVLHKRLQRDILYIPLTGNRSVRGTLVSRALLAFP